MPTFECDMDVKITRRSTFEVSTLLALVPLSITPDQRERGIYYRPDMDQAAWAEAKPFFDAATDAIRRKAGVADLAVSLAIEQRDSVTLAAVATATKRG